MNKHFVNKLAFPIILALQGLPTEVPRTSHEGAHGSAHGSVHSSQGPLNGGVSNGGVSRSGLVLPFLSFFVLFGTFPIFLGFSRFARGWSGDFPD